MTTAFRTDDPRTDPAPAAPAPRAAATLPADPVLSPAQVQEVIRSLRSPPPAMDVMASEPGSMEPSQAQRDRVQAFRDHHVDRLSKAWNPAPLDAAGVPLLRPRSYDEHKVAVAHAYQGDAAVSAALAAHRRMKGAA